MNDDDIKNRRQCRDLLYPAFRALQGKYSVECRHLSLDVRDNGDIVVTEDLGVLYKASELEGKLNSPRSWG